MNNNSNTVEYKMTSTMAKEILKLRKGAAAKRDPQEYLVEYVNRHYGLLRPCVRVLEF